jgi:hypothetical protein
MEESMSRSQHYWTRDVVLARLRAQSTIDELGARVPAASAARKIELAQVISDVESGRATPTQATARFNAVTSRARSASRQNAA